MFLVWLLKFGQSGILLLWVKFLIGNLPPLGIPFQDPSPKVNHF